MIPLINKDNVESADDVYPFGNIKDKIPTAPGTPVNVKTYADFHQFFEKMFSESGLTANGLPDNEYNGFQLWQALKMAMARRGLLAVDFDTIFTNTTSVPSENTSCTATMFGTATLDGKHLKINGALLVTITTAANFNSTGWDTIIFNLTPEFTQVPVSGYMGSAAGAGFNGSNAIYGASALILAGDGIDDETKLRFKVNSGGASVTNGDILELGFSLSFTVADDTYFDLSEADEA